MGKVVNFLGRFPTQHSPGIVVHPVGQVAQLGLVDLCEVRPLGIPSSYHTVMYLVGSFLPGGVAVAVVYLRSMEELSKLSIP